jgi:trigger factor
VLVTEGAEPTLIRERSFPVVIAAEADDQSNEWPFPGFSRKLLGLSAGESRSFNFTFPDDSDLENLRGVTAEFSVQVEQVKTHRLPELNDEFAKSVGDFENIEALRKDIHANLEKSRLEEYNDEFDTQVINKIIESSDIQYPPQMLEREIDEVIHQLEHRLSGQKLDLETYKKTRGIDDEGLHTEAAPVAEGAAGGSRGRRHRGGQRRITK